MKTPVIIPAFNEAEHIGSALKGLDANTVEPFVIVNGEKGARATAKVALEHTPHVYMRSEQGKLPAIQFALRKLREYDEDAYAKPILFMDADTRPLIKREWAPIMASAVAGRLSCSAAGVTLFGDGPLVDRLARNARRVIRAYQDSGSDRLRSAFGANMAINFANDNNMVEHVLELPHVWPGEDRYLLHLLGGGGERERFTQLTSRGSAVLCSARFIKPLVVLARRSPEERHEEALADYAARRASGANYFFDEETDSLRQYADEPS